ncbi:MAG: hypothetical protein ACLP7P_17810 [Rhodomicrobium sp.]
MRNGEDNPRGPPPHKLRSPYIGSYRGQPDALEAERQRLADWQHKLEGANSRFPMWLAVLLFAAVIAGIYLIGSLA